MILQVITDTDRRGAQVFATDLESALRDRGREVRTVALAPGTAGRLLDVPVLGATRTGRDTLAALRREMRAADVVVGHGSTTLPACAVAGLGVPTPFVYRQISDSMFWAPTVLRRLRVRLAMSRADAVVALWRGSAETLRTRLGVPARRISVVPNGVPATRFPHLPRPDRDGAGPVVLYAGALVPEKGVSTAVEAMAHLPTATLLIAGDGPDRGALESSAEEVAPGRVHFLGPVPDMHPVYQRADVVVLPSRGGDSMPGVLIEAGLCGIPCVATPVEAIGDVVLDRLTGILVPPDDPAALAEGVVEAVAGATALGAAARKHCLATFDIQVVAIAWAAVLDRVVAGRQ